MKGSADNRRGIMTHRLRTTALSWVMGVFWSHSLQWYTLLPVLPSVTSSLNTCLLPPSGILVRFDFPFLLSLEEQLNSLIASAPVNHDSLAFPSSPESLSRYYPKQNGWLSLKKKKKKSCQLPRSCSFLSNCNHYDMPWDPCKPVWRAILLFWLTTWIIGDIFSFCKVLHQHKDGCALPPVSTGLWLWFLSTTKT